MNARNRTLAAMAASACIAIATAWPALAQDAPKVAVVEFGEYTVRREVPLNGQRIGSTGVTERVSSEGVRLLRHTDRIEAAPCRRFGAWFQFQPPGQAGFLPITQRLTHPLMTRPDGVSGTVEADDGLLDGEPVLSGFSFTYDWEMVPGTWTFTLLSGGKVLAEKSFEVVAPPGGIASTAGGCDAPIS
ncbi:MAG TPA: DUF3859 domain-containing protein [Acetobacteraceae bacterium]